jgi:HSP20 family protein
MGFLEKLKSKKEVPDEVEEEKETKEEDWLEKEGEVPVDMYQTKDYVILEVPVAGVKASDLEIYTEGDQIVIEGQRKLPEEERDYLIQECFWGRFSRIVKVPVEVEFDEIEASLKDGLLTIKVPKLVKTAGRKKIVIK